MAYSIWELLTFPPEVLEERLRRMTFQEREAERLEALREFEESKLQRESKNA